MAPDRLRIHTQTTNREKNKMKKKKLKKTPSADQEIAKNACQHAFNRMWNFIMHRKRRKNGRSAKIQTKPTKKQWEQICRMAHVLFKFIPFPRPKLRLSEFFFPSPTLFFNCYRRGFVSIFIGYSWLAIMVSGDFGAGESIRKWTITTFTPFWLQSRHLKYRSVYYF